MTSKDAADASSRSQNLHDETQMILDEARMVLPGIQALFGFQLIAVFTEGFRRLADVERLAHLGSLLLVTVAIALIMTPRPTIASSASRESRAASSPSHRD